ncbi:MAG: SDR family NAD(P)-dependent oxidoreductase [Pseudomonadales bacterium]|nr:SDR family NAD(P)-dependent oxidoreductase [Pseudomonadales bacterium]
MSTTPAALVIGAGSSLAQATINELLTHGKAVIAVSRSDVSKTIEDKSRLAGLVSDYSEESIEEIIAGLVAEESSVDQVFIFNGVLHNGSITPEKRLEQVSETQLLNSFRANTVVPALWLKHLKKLLRKQGQVLLTVLSARVGSISDNRKGGWYGYRASKAALNMLLKSVAIEYQREAKNVSFLVYHPGTTDTPLSKPFQRNVSPENLFTPDFAARKLLEVINDLDRTELIQFRDWDGNSISW